MAMPSRVMYDLSYTPLSRDHHVAGNRYARSLFTGEGRLCAN